jgi:hypothetical protein
MIQKLRAGELSRDDMMTAQHTSVFDAFALADRQPGAGEALRRLVACVRASHETLSLEPVVREFGRRPGNTQLGGLSALALRQGECRRPPEDWAPTTHNARRRFGSLARWLLTTYDVPRFLDTAWFAGQRLEARAQQQWFVDVGLGRNIRRSAHLPVVLTKRMAHLLMHGGETVAVSVAMRRAQVLGMGGSEALARAVTRSRLGGSFEHEEFWVSVVKFLVYSPSVAPDDVEPIVEYVYEQKYAPQRVADAEGFVEEGPPMHPGFSMRTRKAGPLIREVSVWRRERERRRSHYAEEWEPCGLKGLDVVEHADGRWVRWRVRELLSVTALRTEGKRMRHCVGTHHGYASACRSGSQSIWSLDATDSTGKRVSGMTIALRNGDRTITEAMGKGNVNLAGLETDDPRRTWLGLCRAIMERWAVPQGITSARPA